MTRAGIVTVAGKPNAGKSTLLNRIVGQKLSIVSAKPQSTRNRIVGIRTEGDVQLIVLDTPGLLDPAYPLQHAMRATSLRAVEEADERTEAERKRNVELQRQLDAEMAMRRKAEDTAARAAAAMERAADEIKALKDRVGQLETQLKRVAGAME